MLSYEPGDSIAHTLDARSKFAVQAGFAAAAFAYTTPRGLAVLTAVTVAILWLTRTPLGNTLWTFRFLMPFLVAAPLLDGFSWGTWFVLEDALGPALASYRVLLVLLVAAAYVRTTPVRESRAAIQWAIPGRAGQFLGMGVSFVFRFLPVLQADIGRIRAAQATRLGTERPLPDRIRLLTVTAFNRAFERADQLALALQARCFSWNPTLPELRFATLDAVTIAIAGGLFAAALYAIV